MIMGIKDNIKIKLGTEKDCIQSVTVEVPAARVKESIEKAFQTVQGKAKVPGFRAGKVPLDIVKQKFQDNAYAEAQDRMLREGVAEAIKSKNLQAVQSPIIQSVKFDPAKAFQFEFKVEIVPQFKLASYKGIKITDKSKPVSDDDVKKNLEKLADTNSTLIESKADTLGKKHFATVNYEGFLDGKPIEGAKAENFLLDMAAPQTIAGLTDGMEGAKLNEERDVKVTFPKDSPAKHLAGKEANFKVKLIAIKEKKVPKLDDDFAKDLGLASFEELKSRVKENMGKEAERNNRRDIERQVIEKLVADNKFPVPASLIDRQEQNLTQRQQFRMAQQGLPMESQTPMLEKMKPQIRKQAEEEVRLAYILNSISDQEKIQVTEEDISAKIEEVLAQTPAAEKKKMEKSLKGQYKEQVGSELKDTKIFDFIIQSAKIKKG